MLCMIFYTTVMQYVKGHPSLSSETVISAKQTIFAYFLEIHCRKMRLRNNNGFHLVGATLPPAY